MGTRQFFVTPLFSSFGGSFRCVIIRFYNGNYCVHFHFYMGRKGCGSHGTIYNGFSYGVRLVTILVARVSGLQVGF